MLLWRRSMTENPLSEKALKTAQGIYDAIEYTREDVAVCVIQRALFHAQADALEEYRIELEKEYGMRCYSIRERIATLLAAAKELENHD